MSSSSETPESSQPLELPKPESLSPIIPGFEVTAFLAQGGMGAIYKGEQTKLERPVAIKILPHSYGEDYNYAERFETEAKAMAKLSHNNIVSVYDYGETTDGEYLFFVMEFIEGSNLFQLLQNGPLEVEQAINVLRQVCSGLQYAHEHGIIHRDIKPSNILVNQRGVVKMADFGLAKVRGISTAGEEDEDTVMGTPEYIAPEALIEGVKIDYRADIYSVGVLTYELLAGKLPSGDFPPLSQTRPEVDRRIDDLVRMAMQEDREARLQQISEIARMLVEIGKSPKLITGKGAKQKRKSKLPRPPRPQAGKAHIPVKPIQKSAKKSGPKTPVVPAQKTPVTSVQKTPVVPVQKTPVTPVQKTPAAPKRKIAILAPTENPAPAPAVTPSPAATPAPVTRPNTTRSQPVRTRSRHRPPPKKNPASAMIAIGVGFVVIILIGVLMLWLKSRGKEPAEEPRTAPPAEKKEEEGGFFGVPLSMAEPSGDPGYPKAIRLRLRD